MLNLDIWVHSILRICIHYKFVWYWLNSQPNIAFKYCSQIDQSLGFVHNGQNISGHQDSAIDQVWSAKPLKSMNQRVERRTLINPLSVGTSIRHRHQSKTARFSQLYWLTYSISFAWKGPFPLWIFNLLGEVGLWRAIINPNTLVGSLQIPCSIWTYGWKKGAFKDAINLIWHL